MKKSVPPTASTERPVVPIREIRGARVLVDFELAALYGVPTSAFNQAVQRNRDRFPPDFVFQLTREEAVLISQNVISTSSHGGRRKLPYAFTEHGALQAANVLKSARAIAMSIYIIRAFIHLREQVAADAAILKRLAEIDRTLLEHDAALRAVWNKLQPLLAPPSDPPKPRIGFKP